MTAAPADPPASAGPPAARTVLPRHRAVVAALLLGTVALGTGAAVWARSAASSAVEQQVVVEVPGSVIAPGVPAGGLVVLAAALALALAGRRGRLVAAAGLVGGGALVAASTVAALGATETAVLSAAQGAVGVAVLDSAVSTTWAPWVALLAGTLAAALGVLVVLVSSAWSSTGRRHENPTRPDGAPADRDEHGTWDALSRGEDPT